MAGWAQVVEANAATPVSARRLVRQLRACEASAIAFCRLLERWGRGDAVPATPGARERGAPARCRPRRDGARGPGDAARRVPRRARARPGRGPLLVRRPRRRRARRVAPDPRAGRRATRARTASPPCTSSSPCSSARSRASTTPPAWTPSPTDRRSGPASSTCTTRSTARPSTTSGHSPPETTVTLGSGCRGEDSVCIVHESEEEKCPSTITDLPTEARKELRARTTAAPTVELTEAPTAVPTGPRTAAQRGHPASTTAAPTAGAVALTEAQMAVRTVAQTEAPTSADR